MQQNCGDTFLWHQPGEESPAQAADLTGGKPPEGGGAVMRSEIKVAKGVKRASRKAAIACMVPVP